MHLMLILGIISLIASEALTVSSLHGMTTIIIMHVYLVGYLVVRAIEKKRNN